MSITDKLYLYYETAIIEGSLRPGSRLPSERKLAEQFQLSRASAREAIQQLKAKGLIVSQQGGGHYVSSQLENEIAKPMLRILENQPDAHFDLLEFRRSIEGDCAYNAALRANEMDLAAMASAFSTLKSAYQGQDIKLQAETDAAFHLAIAEASHNLLFLHLAKSLLSVMKTNVLSSITHMFENDISKDVIMNQHTAIYEAIVNRQPCAAKEAAHKHIRLVEEVLQNLEREQLRFERSQRRHQSI